MSQRIEPHNANSDTLSNTLSYHFGSYTVDVARRELLAQQKVVTVQPKVFDLLVYLLARRDRVVGKDELQSALWPDVVVTEASLTRCVTKCRHALGDDGGQQAIIKTVHGRGYRFVAQVNKQEQHHTNTALLEEAVPAPANPEAISIQNSEQPSLVVLPFRNVSDHAEDEMFANGLTEDIIVDLSRNGWLFVIARNSAFSYKGQDVTSQVVAQELGVRYVVEGSVRKFGEQLRVVVELVDANRGTQEWSQRYDRPVTSLFELQDEISRDIVTALGSELRRAEGRRARQADADNLDAWGLVHRGMAVSWSSFNDASNSKAEQFYRQAIAIAPNDARARAFLANSLAMRAINGWAREPDKTQQEARHYCQQALDLAPDDPIVLGQLAHMHSCLFQPEMAIDLFRRSIDIDPNGIFSLAMRSFPLVAVGRAQEAVAAVTDAIRRSPRDPSISWYLTMLSWAHLQLGDPATAVAQAREGIAYYNGWHACWVTLGLTLAAVGQLEEGRAAVDRGREMAAGITFAGYEAFFHYVAKDNKQGAEYSALLKKVWLD